MLFRLIFGLLGVVVAVDRVQAQFVAPGEPTTREVSGPSYRWRDVVGRPVTIEGLAWGWFAKGLGQHVQIDGIPVYVDAPNEKADGRLVRVTGVLTIAEYVPPAQHPQGLATQSVSSAPFRYWRLTSAKWELLDRAEWPWMRLATVSTAKK